MKQDRDWTQQLRSALRDAELTPPEGGWERLERALRAAPPPRAIPLRRYGLRLAAAAAVLVLAFTGGLLWLPDRESIERAGELLAESVVTGSAATNPEAGGVSAGRASDDGAGGSTAKTVDAPATRHAAGLLAANRTGRSSQAVAAFALSGPVPDPTAEREADPEAVTDPESQDGEARDSRAAADERAERQSAAAARSSRASFAGEPFVARAPLRKRASLGLFAGGGVAGNVTGMGGQTRAYSMMVPSNDAGGALLVPRYDYREASFRHHQPLSFGLTVRRHFAHGLSLESGVVYTLLRSDVTLRPGADELSQRLHMMGIPLRLNWQFFERGRFSLYIGAGGMVEKCVSARLGSDKLDESGVEWSVAAAAGAQYRLGGLVGLYFEPEGSYYLNETRARTARTESPLTFTLRLGVRLNF
ncbi:hypothetical protein [Alistipes sp.]|uniref:hypothetical protein n=1 Tax=Alistipes sp. TaxID=1872444 RepID=UPI003AF173FF